MVWTARDTPDQTGRVAVVTGANSGLGLILARELARAGARVVMGCRDTVRGEAAATRVRTAVPRAEVEVMQLDLADLSSVRTFADRCTGHYHGLDLLINNAGVMAVPYSVTRDGFEMQLGTNHLGHFALTGMLLDTLLARPAPRVVTVSSLAHRIGRIDFADLQSARGYNAWLAYGQSKLANLLFAYEFDRRAAEAGLGLTSVAAHPGYAATNLQLVGPRMAGSRLQEKASALANRWVAQSDAMGALPALYAAVGPGVPGGAFVGPDGPFELRGYPRIVDSGAASKDRDAARRLWEASAELTGVRFASLQ